MVNLRSEDNGSDEEELSLAWWRRRQQCLVLLSSNRKGMRKGLSERDRIACRKGMESLVGTGWNRLSFFVRNTRTKLFCVLYCRSLLHCCIVSKQIFLTVLVRTEFSFATNSCYFFEEFTRYELATSSKKSRGMIVILFFFRSCRVIEALLFCR